MKPKIHKKLSGLDDALVKPKFGVRRSRKWEKKYQMYYNAVSLENYYVKFRLRAWMDYEL